MSAQAERDFDAVYNDLFRDVYAYFHMCFGEQAAEDLAQEVFLRVWKALAAEKTPENWRAWVFRCAVNLKNDYLRRKYTQSGVQSFETMPMELSSGGTPTDGEALAIQSALARLSGADRELLALKGMGFKSAEIGELLSLSGSAVRTRLQKAKRNFEISLETEGVQYA